MNHTLHSLQRKHRKILPHKKKERKKKTPRHEIILTVVPPDGENSLHHVAQVFGSHLQGGGGAVEGPPRFRYGLALRHRLQVLLHFLGHFLQLQGVHLGYRKSGGQRGGEGKGKREGKGKEKGKGKGKEKGKGKRERKGKGKREGKGECEGKGEGEERREGEGKGEARGKGNGRRGRKIGMGIRKEKGLGIGFRRGIWKGREK